MICISDLLCLTDIILTCFKIPGDKYLSTIIINKKFNVFLRKVIPIGDTHTKQKQNKQMVRLGVASDVTYQSASTHRTCYKLHCGCSYISFYIGTHKLRFYMTVSNLNHLL